MNGTEGLFGPSCQKMYTSKKGSFRLCCTTSWARGFARKFRWFRKKGPPALHTHTEGKKFDKNRFAKTYGLRGGEKKKRKASPFLLERKEG